MCYHVCMKSLVTAGFPDYALLDTGNGKRLERFGSYTIVRPDPQCIWEPRLDQASWENVDAVFEKNEADKEVWVRKSDVPKMWLMHYNDLAFYGKLSPFKHTGVFPEQHVMWDWLATRITEANDQNLKSNDSINVLNLFGYTGIASLACAAAGAKVTHVDASYPTIGWARDNQEASSLSDKPIRWIEDDCQKFVSREIKRGTRYDGIIMDPPVFGHGPSGERWEFFESFPKLLKLCTEVLSDKPLFVLINAYAISASSIMLGNILDDVMKPFGGVVEYGELILKDSNDRELSTGMYARWHN